jgi:glutamine synthetase
MEVRSPDPAANPYLAFALLLAAGLEGVEQALPLPPPVDGEATALALLPDSLAAALALAESSAFVTGVLGEEMLNAYGALKREEVARFQRCGDPEEFYRENYFRFY